MHHPYHYFQHENNINKSMHSIKYHHDTTDLIAAKLFASRGYRRRSYDDQEGDNDINIILQPSDLDDIEKQARAKYAQFNASLIYLKSQQSETAGKTTTSTTTTTTTTTNKSTKTTKQTIANSKESTAQDTISSDHDPTGADPQTCLGSSLSALGISDEDEIDRLNSSMIERQTDHDDGDDRVKLKALRNIFQDIKLAKCLLDQDYNQTVRLFIRKSALNWNFNSFTFDALCCGRSLTELLLHLFDYYNLYNIFNLDIIKVLKCFRLLEFGYHSTNPYHNSVHAADVTQAMHCFMQENKIKKHMTNLEILCSILAAVCHDLDHPGVNQSFLVATNNPLASLYQNNSVLENHHWRFALCIFKESNIFEHFEQDVLDDMKEQLKHLILATDIARQNEYLKRFRDLTSSHKFSLSNTADRALVLQMALKCADLGNPCRPWLISRVWSNLICDEFYRMGQIERRLGVPLTPICQREKTSIASIQTDFFRFIVLPLLELWHNFLKSPLSSLLMSNFDHNYKRWQRADRIVQQLRRRKSVACLGPVEDNSSEKVTDEGPDYCTSLLGPTRSKVCRGTEKQSSRNGNNNSNSSNNPESRSEAKNDPGLRCRSNSGRTSGHCRRADNLARSSTFFDPTMETLCSRHSFVAVKRASSDYIKSGNRRLELLRDFQLNRIIEKSPLLTRRSKKFSQPPSAGLGERGGGTTMSKDRTKPTRSAKTTTATTMAQGAHCGPAATSGRPLHRRDESSALPSSSQDPAGSAGSSSASKGSESPKKSLPSSNTASPIVPTTTTTATNPPPPSSSAQCCEQLPAGTPAPSGHHQPQYRKVLSPIQDRAESGTSPEGGCCAGEPPPTKGKSSTPTPISSSTGSPPLGTKAKASPNMVLLPAGRANYQPDSDDQEDSASCSTSASRASSDCSSPIMQRSISSRASLAHEHQHQHNRQHPKGAPNQQHIKQLYETSSGPKVNSTPTSRSRFSVSVSVIQTNIPTYKFC